jgi:hypothetical protein
MAAEDAASSYRQGIVWVVGMSAAAAGGAFLHYDQAVALPTAAKVGLVLVVVLFLVAVWSGVNCLFWIFYKTSGEEKLKQLEEDLAQKKIQPADYAAKKTKEEGEVADATKSRNRYHATLLWTFALAVLFSSVLFAFGTFLSAKSTKDTCTQKQKDLREDAVKPVADRFVVVQSAVHRTAHGKEAHTFLLDQQKGSLWVMTCSKRGIVEFDRVQTVGLNGAQEDPSK